MSKDFKFHENFSDEKYIKPSFKNYENGDVIKFQLKGFKKVSLNQLYSVPFDQLISANNIVDDTEVKDWELQFSPRTKVLTPKTILFWEFFGYYHQLKFIYEGDYTDSEIDSMGLDVPIVFLRDNPNQLFINPLYYNILLTFFGWDRNDRQYPTFEKLFIIDTPHTEGANFWTDEKIRVATNHNYLHNAIEMVFKFEKLRVFMAVLCNGGTLDDLWYNEKDSIDSLLDKLPQTLTKYINKNILNEAKKQLSISKKMEKKDCQSVLTELGLGDCENPKSNKRFKNCCLRRITEVVMAKEINSYQRKVEKEIYNKFDDELTGDQERSKLKPIKFDKPSVQHLDVLEEYLTIPPFLDGYTKKTHFVENQFVEKFGVYNDYYYKVIECFVKYGKEWSEMIGDWWMGVYLCYFYKRMNVINNTREIGSKNKGVAHEGEGQFSVEKALRMVKGSKEMRDGFEYDFEARNLKPNKSYYTLHKGSRIDKVMDKTIKVYRGIESLRHWIGSSWAFEEENTNYFIYVHGLRSSRYEEHLQTQDGSVMKGYLCELEIDVENILRYETRSVIKETEVIICKGDLDKSRLKIWEVEVRKQLRGIGDVKKIREVPASEIPNNKLFGTDEYPSYLFD